MRILILSNVGIGLYKFRKELLGELIRKNFEVYISLPRDEYVPFLEDLGCGFVETKLNRRGTNPFSDLKIVGQYLNILKKVKPDVVLTYTIKPNIYGGIACQLMQIPYVTSITGLGTAVENEGLLQKITLILYKIGLKQSACVFFQNKVNLAFLKDKKIVQNNIRLVPGSGVNLDEHQLVNYPDDSQGINFLFIGRVMKAKGIEELLSAAKIIKYKYPDIHIDVVGACEEDYTQQLLELHELEIINYHGHQNDVRPFIKKAHATVLPSYHEGTANVLLESASAGRPLLASNVPGCIETFDEGLSGFGFEVKSVESLVNVFEKFIELPNEKRKEMGIAGRVKMENEFNRKIVIKAYLDEIHGIVDGRNII